MDSVVTDDQRMLLDTSVRFIEETYPIERVRTGGYADAATAGGVPAGHGGARLVFDARARAARRRQRDRERTRGRGADRRQARGRPATRPVRGQQRGRRRPGAGRRRPLRQGGAAARQRRGGRGVGGRRTARAGGVWRADRGDGHSRRTPHRRSRPPRAGRGERRLAVGHRRRRRGAGPVPARRRQPGRRRDGARLAGPEPHDSRRSASRAPTPAPTHRVRARIWSSASWRSPVC